MRAVEGFGGRPDDRFADRRVAELSPCRCGHGRGQHEHYRRGDDCGLCRCETFSPWRAEHGLPASLLAS